ncbi:hypothetical protein IEQ34_006636 [Dendrobium chrysotoxum]|uniref:Uncharacterized protein n=1 Tax=Dendrobium chrysotoxum TaxID=161865 RepID=A0AAV7H8R1_DENCH|nr:hypothetical protein IEQ34_006636 [Dendrobium chrysotoxum]
MVERYLSWRKLRTQTCTGIEVLKRPDKPKALKVPQPTCAIELSNGWYSPYCNLRLVTHLSGSSKVTSPREASGEEGSEQRSRGRCHAPAAYLGAAPSECGLHWVSFRYLLIKEKLWRISEKECFRIQGENELFYRVLETIRHLAINANNIEVVGEIEK